MAWIDDRIWCHPKFAGLSAAASWLWVCGTAYSSGFHTRGYLPAAIVRQLGGTSRTRGELVKAGLWVEAVDGGVAVAGWEEHNGPRDDRKAKDRERKRQARLAARLSAGLSADNGVDVSADVRTLKSEVVKSEDQRPLKAVLDGSDTGSFQVPPRLLKDMPA